MATEMVTCTGCSARVPLCQSWGDWDQPFCMECWFNITQGEDEDWYGIAPQTHDLGKTGSFIGSTTFTKLPEPDETGWIDCSFMGSSWVGTWFKPDNEDPSCGVYSKRMRRMI